MYITIIIHTLEVAYRLSIDTEISDLEWPWSERRNGRPLFSVILQNLV